MGGGRVLSDAIPFRPVATSGAVFPASLVSRLGEVVMATKVQESTPKCDSGRCSWKSSPQTLRLDLLVESIYYNSPPPYPPLSMRVFSNTPKWNPIVAAVIPALFRIWS